MSGPALMVDMSDGLDVCQCGDYRKHHSGPEMRGSCRICRDGDGVHEPEGCQRFSLWLSTGAEEGGAMPVTRTDQ